VGGIPETVSGLKVIITLNEAMTAHRTQFILGRAAVENLKSVFEHLLKGLDSVSTRK
jgi:hypothetical protein